MIIFLDLLVEIMGESMEIIKNFNKNLGKFEKKPKIIMKPDEFGEIQ